MWDDAKWGEANEEGSGEESDESDEDSDDDDEEDDEEDDEDSEEGEDEDEDKDEDEGEGGAAWTADDDAKPSAVATTANATATATAAEDTSWLRRKGGLIRKGGPSVNDAARKRRGGGRRVLYIQMEYCKRTLHDVLAEGALSEDKIWRLLRQLLGGLQVSTSDGL
jgi:hypothetical protein